MSERDEPLNENRIPVYTLPDLDSLDEAEILDGYKDGFEGLPCGDNRSRSYWHGWRNAQVNKGRQDIDWQQARLAREYLERTRGA